MAVRVMIVRQWQKWHHHQLCFSRAASPYHYLSPPSKLLSPSNPKPNAAAAALRRFHLTSLLSAPRNTVDLGPRGLKCRRDALLRLQSNGGDSEGGDAKKSRNEAKRESRRAVRWGMDLASFSASRIKRILKVASIEQEPLYDALLLVKSFGPDVREGKRRQFNYIGKLLRDADPELMNSLIQAVKEDDHSKFLQICASSGAWNINNLEDEDEGSSDSNPIATRWLDGLISKDVAITHEVYAINSVEFDRQELGRLIRKVHSFDEKCVSHDQISVEENKHVEPSLMRVKKSLALFLRDLAKKMQASEGPDMMYPTS